jgi:hypothetical protein
LDSNRFFGRLALKTNPPAASIRVPEKETAGQFQRVQFDRVSVKRVEFVTQ